MARKGNLFGGKECPGGGRFDSPAVVKINLTPMIDCTFLLIIFFMVVSEMASLDMEEVALPYADQAKTAQGQSLNTVTINIRKDDARDGIVRVMGSRYDKNKLAELIRKEAIRSGREFNPDHPDVEIHKLNVRIRCDRDAKYETVQWVLDACARNGVYRTKLAASPDTD